ncbi:MAG: DUF349 domain-containing protein [Bacteroidales bacterium]
MTQDTQNSAQEEQFKDKKNLENVQSTELKKDSANFNEMNLKDIVQYFQDMIERGDQQEMYKNADSVKAAFYKTLKKEKIASGMTFPSKEESENLSEEESISVNPFAELERGFKELYNRYKIERTSYLRILDRQKEENLEKKNQIIEELKELLDKQEDLQHTFPTFRELQSRWRSIGPVPQSYNKDLWETYQFLVEKFYDFVKINNELRDLDLKKNLEVKTGLCEKAEELMNEPNVVLSFRNLQKLHEEWREIGPVSKELREELWERFKAATTNINKRQQDYFEGLKIEHKKNLELKTELCIKAEAVANIQTEGKDWNGLSKEMEKLQQEWKTIGFASKKENQKIYDRFRAACDKFYNGKREFYSSFKKIMQENLVQKIALCEQAESLKESEDWKKTTDQLISLQKKWKEIGPVARKQSDAVWKRFRAACDFFFENKSKFYSSMEEDYEDNLKLKNDLIKEINKYKRSEDESEHIAAFREFQNRWIEIGYVPIKDKNSVQSAYREAIEAKFPDLRSSKHENKLVRFKKHIKEVKTSPKGDRSIKYERDKLFQKFRTLEQDIALWENNMGFFAKSKKADNIISDMEDKISNAKEELLQIEEKIKLIDKQYE